MRMRPAGPSVGGPTGTRPGPLATGCLDVVLGLLVVALEAVICAVVMYSNRRPEPVGEQAPHLEPADTVPPAMDWSATLTLASFTAVACLIGVVLLRHGLPLAGVVQLLAACVLCVMTFLAWHGDYRLAHPASASAAPPPHRPAPSGHQWTCGRTREPPAVEGRPQAPTTTASLDRVRLLRAGGGGGQERTGGQQPGRQPVRPSHT